MKRLIIGLIPDDFSQENDIVIGPWCFVHDQEKLFSHDLVCEPDPYKNFEELKKDANIAFLLTDFFIGKLTKTLNAKNHTSYSEKYWRVILTPYLTTLIQIILERYRRIKQIYRLYQSGLKVELLEIDKPFKFINNKDFLQNGVFNPLFNHWLISQIIIELNPGNWIFSTIKIKEREIYNFEKKDIKPKLTQKIRSKVYENFYFSSIYGVGLIKGIIWDLKIRQKRPHPKEKGHQGYSNLHFTNNVQIMIAIINRLLTQTLPLSITNVNRIKHKPKPRFIICGPVMYNNEKMKQILALHYENNSIIIPVQHGCRYGTLYSIPYIAQVEFLFGKFISWGWTKQSDYVNHFIALPSPYLSRKKKRQNGKIIFVGQHSSLINYRLDTAPQPLQYIQNTNEIIKFFHNLNKVIRKEIQYRPYPFSNEQINYHKIASKHFPFIKIFNGNLNKELFKFRLIVTDNPGTVFHQALAANIPVIAFWKDEYWGFEPDAKTLTEYLREAGVVYSTGIEASQKLNSIYNNIESWWNQKKIQEAVKNWSRVFALSDNKWEKQWRKWFNSINY